MMRIFAGSVRRTICGCVCAVAVTSAPALLAADRPSSADALPAWTNPWLCQGNWQTEEQARVQLERFGRRYEDRATWEKRAEEIRAGILRGLGFERWPERSPLRPIRRAPRAHDGYSVENVAFESMPGFFVCGNLYRPPGREGKSPALLLTHGHGNPETGGRFGAEVQALAGTLARAGAIVFAYEMVGYGESTQYPHKGEKTMALQWWNGVRAIDFLESLPEVDARRIAMTGASGGATQAIVLTALDPRIAVSVPVVMVSAHFFGGCSCESGLPIHRSPEHETNNAEIAALAAPRPQLLVSVGGDWTKNTPSVEFPYIRRVYSLYGEEDDVSNVHLPDEKHNYGPLKRAAAVAFLTERLGLSLGKVRASDTAVDESAVTIEPREALLVFSAEQPRPSTALLDAAAIEARLYRPAP